MRTRHGNELLRSIEPHGFVSQGSKVTEIAAGSATEIKNRVGRIAFYRIEECCVILADIVVSCPVPEGPCKPIIIRDRRFTEAPELFRMKGASSSYVIGYELARKMAAAELTNIMWTKLAVNDS